jgi:hypothetical protein
MAEAAERQAAVIVAVLTVLSLSRTCGPSFVIAVSPRTG